MFYGIINMYLKLKILRMILRNTSWGVFKYAFDFCYSYRYLGPFKNHDSGHGKY